MEVSIYMNSQAMSDNKSLFKRVVLCPDAFDIRSFVSNMKAIFGESVIVDIIFI